ALVEAEPEHAGLAVAAGAVLGVAQDRADPRLGVAVLGPVLALVLALVLACVPTFIPGRDGQRDALLRGRAQVLTDGADARAEPVEADRPVGAGLLAFAAGLLAEAVRAELAGQALIRVGALEAKGRRLGRLDEAGARGQDRKQARALERGQDRGAHEARPAIVRLRHRP